MILKALHPGPPTSPADGPARRRYSLVYEELPIETPRIHEQSLVENGSSDVTNSVLSSVFEEITRGLPTVWPNSATSTCLRSIGYHYTREIDRRARHTSIL